MVRHPDTLRQICADRPDLVQYLDSLLTEATATPVLYPDVTAGAAYKAVAFSHYHVQWRAFIGKTRFHLERCDNWHLAETVTPEPGGATAPTPAPTWIDADLRLTVLAIEQGVLSITSQWHYGPLEDGLDYNCQLKIEGWDLVLNVNWFRRTLHTLFYQKPQITVIRATMPHGNDEIEHGDALDHAETIGGLG